MESERGNAAAVKCAQQEHIPCLPENIAREHVL